MGAGVAYSDCFYRNVYKFEYLIPVDIDEVIRVLF